MQARVDAALQAVGLPGFERRSVGKLSSGQLQRTLFARLLVQDAQLILLDEPFNAVDSTTTIGLVGRWYSSGTAKAAPRWPCCTTTLRCMRISPKPCCSRASASHGDQPPGC
jgi:ABC-type ATPase with predicted acetyltransferase domain